MQTIDAIELLSELSLADLESLLPPDADVTATEDECSRPATLVCFLAAAAELTGGLYECETIDDIRNLIVEFHGLLGSDVITDEMWSDCATELFHRLMDGALQMGRATARQNRGFSQAELN